MLTVLFFSFFLTLKSNVIIWDLKCAFGYCVGHLLGTKEYTYLPLMNEVSVKCRTRRQMWVEFDGFVFLRVPRFSPLNQRFLFDLIRI